MYLVKYRWSACLLGSISWVRVSPISAYVLVGTYSWIKKIYQVHIQESARAWVCNIRWKSTSSGNAEPMGDKNEGQHRGGKGDGTCDHGMSRTMLRVNIASHEFSWQVKMTIHYKFKVNQCAYWPTWLSVKHAYNTLVTYSSSSQNPFLALKCRFGDELLGIRVVCPQNGTGCSFALHGMTLVELNARRRRRLTYSRWPFASWKISIHIGSKRTKHNVRVEHTKRGHTHVTNCLYIRKYHGRTIMRTSCVYITGKPWQKTDEKNKCDERRKFWTLSVKRKNGKTKKKKKDT